MKAITSQELVARHKRLPKVDHASMAADADEFFGTEDRVGDGDWNTAPLAD